MYVPKCYYMCGPTIFMTKHYPLNNRMSYDKKIFRMNKYELSELCCMQTGLADLKVGASGSDKSGF